RTGFERRRRRLAAEQLPGGVLRIVRIGERWQRLWVERALVLRARLMRAGEEGGDQRKNNGRSRHGSVPRKAANLMATDGQILAANATRLRAGSPLGIAFTKTPQDACVSARLAALSLPDLAGEPSCAVLQFSSPRYSRWSIRASRPPASSCRSTSPRSA